MKAYKGIDLLEKILEFIALTPDDKLWTLNALQGNRPRLIRLKQVNALVSAFFPAPAASGLVEKAKNLFAIRKGESIQTILSGAFLQEKTIADYSELVALMKTTVKATEKFESEAREIKIEDLLMPYQQLIKYKKRLRKLLTFNSGWLEASSITSWFSIQLTNSISSNLSGKYSELDRALELFINPGNLTFTEEELIAKYNFPTENLQEIDMDSW